MFLDRAQGRGLPGSGGTFDHDQWSVAGQGADHGGLGRVDPDQAASADPGLAGRLRRPARDPGEDVGLDVEDLR